MKISGITPWIVDVPVAVQETQGTQGTVAPRRHRQYVFVQVETDEGITGWGEITTYPGAVANRAVCAMLRELAPLLVGEDPSRIERIWQRIFRAFTYMGTRGATTAITSGVDIALWDIRGKALGLPVYELLGGPVRDTISLYTHFPYAADPKEAARRALVPVEAGYMAIKTDPFFEEMGPKGTAYLDGQISAAGEQRGVDIVAAIREAVGPQVEVLIDAHALYNVPTAVRLAHRLAPFNITWFEEPVPPESYHALKQVRDQVPTRICVGERLHTRFEFVPIFEQHLADFVMPDVTWTGGISELKKIATMAEAYYIPVSPHDASGPINVLAGAHVMMTVPNFYRLETTRADLGFYDAFITTPLDVRGGELRLSSRPGLGTELDLDYLRAHAAPGWGA
ncbi:MAG TPA: mandelate racemase/muconate lactonizing enzyme family protein [Chloroflexota bacterium]|nr:mandelate racemase/muconate lactonizing enzyme family protein [Chloroflexota bacterium]